MVNFRSVAIVLTLILTLVGGIAISNAQDKPPLLGTPSVPTYKQTPPVPGQAPLPPAQEAVQPPPPAPPVQPRPVLPGMPQEIAKNASVAVTTAQKAKKYLAPGKVWSTVNPRGEVEVKAAIIYDGTAVAVLHFDPSNGLLLPLGISPVKAGVSPQVIENVKRKLPAIVNSLEVLNGAEYIEPENAWCIPLAYKDMIVAHLKIYVDGIHIVPDYPANQEMRAYGK